MAAITVTAYAETPENAIYEDIVEISYTTMATGTLQIIVKAEQSGNPIYGTTFGVYHAAGNRQQIVELNTNVDGKISFPLEPGEYYLRNYQSPFGFLTENARIFFTIAENNVTIVEITMQRDMDIPYANDSNISLPQTGELPPVMNYVLGISLILISLLCGIGFLKQYKEKQETEKVFLPINKTPSPIVANEYPRMVFNQSRIQNLSLAGLIQNTLSLPPLSISRVRFILPKSPILITLLL